MNIPLDDIPGLKRNVARARRIEDAWRDLAFLPVHEEICGVPVLQLTLRRLNILIFSDSPFLSGARRTAEDIAKFLWIVSPAYNLRNLGRRDFLASIAAIHYARASRAIDRYLDRALLDRPAASGKGGVLISASFVAIMVDRIATAYGWDEARILDTPVARLYQYLRLINLRNDPKAPQISRLSDRIKQRSVRRYLAHLNPEPGPVNS